MLAAVPLALWVVANPLVGAVAVGAIAGLVAVGPRVVWLARCLATCRRLTVALGSDVRVTVTRGRPCEPR